jgi:hypothetical protein
MLILTIALRNPKVFLAFGQKNCVLGTQRSQFIHSSVQTSSKPAWVMKGGQSSKWKATPSFIPPAS